MNPNKQTDESDDFLPFWDHLEELRCVLVRVFAIVVVGILLSFFFHEHIISFATSPIQKLKYVQVDHGFIEEQPLNRVSITNWGSAPVNYQLPEGAFVSEKHQKIKQLSPNSFLIPRGETLFIDKRVQNSLFVLGPMEGMAITLKLCLWVGIIGTSPLWILTILRFISPALKTAEKRLIGPFLMLSLVFICGGLFLGFYITIPIANHYLQTFNQGVGTNLWSVANYLDYTLFLMLANAAALEVGIVGLFLVHLGIISEKWLISQRRAMIVGSFIAGALLTPPDILTQFLLAGIFILLYEGLVFYAKIRSFFQRNRGCENKTLDHLTRT